ncbi:4-(cytidine 5'-diphospho)-2-C-methyl-D-erythritol kinase [Longimicrobium terrae]|uniref:4-diphosphocytidyl-2-C-methyl-D-erythritol kinase n=1 Tax=Longimicrobium terrae TaxID=1639882 RepID=A0A841H463_9BACT|nr:4-diphosphocytidyl-2-C-methyl-D-erythritol kinase [Longimicrobium terrae]MBB6072768.1 4-diphosphocytidyl-2-C-methyl-D-erythritol kinase [Longimicrobium terrae]NNC30614.1 4-(cytidine 5'-diphospho)-2-C-methyl-D-erythritol kinase [Longimicrobium terrae]
MSDSVSVDAPAKVNLFLHVLAREASGYHGLETLFCALSLADAVTVRRGGTGVRLRVDGGVDTGPAERNLAVRAAEAFHARIGAPAAVEIELVKRIPAQAGMGGGSSDAAATLRALNALHGEPLDRAALLQLAIELGSDVPFFLCGSPLALAWSRGERLMALSPLPARPVLVAHPGVAMPTPEAFRAIAERRGGGYTPRARALPADGLSSWEAVAAVAENDFQPVVEERIPFVGLAVAAMRRSGARIAMMAGSGSSVFGVFDSEDERDDAGERIRGLRMKTWAAQTMEAEPVARVDPGAASG